MKRCSTVMQNWLIRAEISRYLPRLSLRIRCLVDINVSVLALVLEAGRGKGSGIEIERRHGLVYTLRAGKIVRITHRRTPKPSKPPDWASKRVGFEPACCYSRSLELS
jgi:hypothetical protein